MNKFSVERIRVIDEAINRGDYPSQIDLQKFCKKEIGVEVTDRTIRNDIKVLKTVYKAPIKSSRKFGGYYYSDEFDLQVAVLSATQEMNKIQLAFETLRQYQFLQAFEGLAEAFNKIEQAIHINIKEGKGNQYIHFEEATISGKEHIPLFLEAIKRRRKVSFLYETYKTKVKSKPIIAPYFIKEYNNRWYIIGEDEEWESFRTVALDRVTNPEVLDKSFVRNKTFNLSDFFKNVFGMTVYNKPPEDIILEFKDDMVQAKYFVSKPFCKYEVLEWYDEKQNIPKQIKIHLKSNYELQRKIVSMGDEVKVIAPDKFKYEVVQKLRGSLEQYGEGV